MKYISADRLNDFEFHDSQLKFNNYDAGTLSLFADNLNIHKETEQNPIGCDMETGRTMITFEGFSDVTFEPGREWKKDAIGNYYTDDPLTIYEGDEALARLTEELIDGIQVFGLTVDENKKCTVEACGTDPFFTFTFSFTHVRAEWDVYKSKAWYEKHICLNKKLNISTPDGDEETVCQIWLHEEENENWAANLVFSFAGKDVIGRGRTCPGIDAFEDAGKQLPEGTYLRCCADCRYGVLDPGNKVPGKIYCMRKMKISKENDIVQLLSNEEEKNRRKRSFCDICKSFERRNVKENQKK